MTSNKQTESTSAFTTLANRHETMMKKVAEPLAALQADGDWAGELGNRIVYLKFHATTCFQAEQEIMLGHRLSTYGTHKQQHENFREELNRLLAEVSRPGADRQSLTGALNRLQNGVKQHAAEHDRDLFELMGKDERQSVTVRSRDAFFPRPGTLPAVCFYTA